MTEPVPEEHQHVHHEHVVVTDLRSLSMLWTCAVYVLDEGNWPRFEEWIRVHLPEGMDLTALTQKSLHEVVHALNPMEAIMRATRPGWENRN